MNNEKKTLKLQKRFAKEREGGKSGLTIFKLEFTVQIKQKFRGTKGLGQRHLNEMWDKQKRRGMKCGVKSDPKSRKTWHLAKT